MSDSVVVQLLLIARIMLRPVLILAFRGYTPPRRGLQKVHLLIATKRIIRHHCSRVLQQTPRYLLLMLKKMQEEFRKKVNYTNKLHHPKFPVNQLSDSGSIIQGNSFWPEW